MAVTGLSLPGAAIMTLVGGAIFAFLGGPILQVKGITPNFHIVDTRETSDVVRAALVDIFLFGALALGTIYLRSV